MSALSIMIIRHAEKPGESWPGPGLTPAGDVEKKSLVIRGGDYPQPAVIYAADPNATTGGGQASVRWKQSVRSQPGWVKPVRNSAGLLGAQGDRQRDPAGDNARSEPSRTAQEVGWGAIRCRPAL
jgi:hypothetical protein